MFGLFRSAFLSAHYGLTAGALIGLALRGPYALLLYFDQYPNIHPERVAFILAGVRDWFVFGAAIGMVGGAVLGAGWASLHWIDPAPGHRSN